MAYTVKYRGAEIECATVGEVVALLREFPGSRYAVADTIPSSASNGAGRLTQTRYREFLGYLDSNKKQLLRLLVENPHGKTDDSIRKALSISDNKQLGGVMSGISKLAKRAGLSVEDILTSQWVKVGDEEMKEYKASASFRSMAMEIGGLK